MLQNVSVAVKSRIAKLIFSAFNRWIWLISIGSWTIFDGGDDGVLRFGLGGGLVALCGD